MVRTHGINPPYSTMTENRGAKAERKPAPANLEREENSRFPKIQSGPLEPGRRRLCQTADDGNGYSHRRTLKPTATQRGVTSEGAGRPRRTTRRAGATVRRVADGAAVEPGTGSSGTPARSRDDQPVGRCCGRSGCGRRGRSEGPARQGEPSGQRCAVVCRDAARGATGRLSPIHRGGVPTGIRTRVSALKGPRPRPLDDGDEGVLIGPASHDGRNTAL
jgi:hypothetical protein